MRDFKKTIIAISLSFIILISTIIQVIMLVLKVKNDDIRKTDPKNEKWYEETKQ